MHALPLDILTRLLIQLSLILRTRQIYIIHHIIYVTAERRHRFMVTSGLDKYNLTSTPTTRHTVITQRLISLILGKRHEWVMG